MKKFSLALVIPVYNEEECIEEVLLNWHTQLKSHSMDSFCMLVYDDGSSDRTYSLIEKMRSHMPELRLFHHENIGHGPTLLKGYTEGFSLAKWVLQIDSDNEINPEDFPLFWKQKQGLDFIIGKRKRDSPWIRQIITGLSRNTIAWLLGKGIYDVNCPFRLLRSDAFEQEIPRIPTETFAPNLLISGLAIRKSMRIKEVPITHRFRATGHASIRKFKLIRVAVVSFIQTLQFFIFSDKDGSE